MSGHNKWSSIKHKKGKADALRGRAFTKITREIITAAKMCEPGLDEVVAYTKALDDEGIPYFVSEFEERMTNFDSLQIQLETFIENLLFA